MRATRPQSPGQHQLPAGGAHAVQGYPKTSQAPDAARWNLCPHYPGNLHSEAIARLAQRAQVSGKIACRGRGVGVVLAEHAAAGQGVLVQLASLGVVAHGPERPGKVGGGRLRIFIVIADRSRQCWRSSLVRSWAARGVAAGQQVPARAARHRALLRW
jgi:hypothetical protein